MAFMQVRGHVGGLRSGLDRCRVTMLHAHSGRTVAGRPGASHRAGCGPSTRERPARPPVPEARGRESDGVARHPLVPVESARPAGTLGAVTRPTPRAPQLVVRRRTSVLTAGLAVAGALALSGCQLTSPQQTMVPYQPADGVNVTLGSSRSTTS